MSLAFTQFASADGRLPQAARKGQPKPLDWVFWQPDRGFAGSAIGRFYPRFEPQMLRCPADSDYALRAFSYSYTLNGYTERQQVVSLGPAGIVLLAEESKPNDGCWGSRANEDALTRRHAGSAMAAFADGHVQLLKIETEGER
jgi:prepilin-type processing-associated H-X9-DG protein